MGMTGPDLDLDALREALAHLDRASTSIGCVTYYGERLSVEARDTIVRETRAVLALVEEQRECIDKLNGAVERDDALMEEQGTENERLREALKHYGTHQMVEAPSRFPRSWMQCPAFWNEENECICGLRDALAGSPAAKEGVK